MESACDWQHVMDGWVAESNNEGTAAAEMRVSGSRPSKYLLSYHSAARPGSFQARDNISQFIGWSRSTLAVPDTLLFETEDLVSRRNERNVLLCLLEVLPVPADLLHIYCSRYDNTVWQESRYNNSCGLFAACKSGENLISSSHHQCQHRPLCRM